MDPIDFSGDGLVPCIMQDASTGEVLTLAYMNEEALQRTRGAPREMHFWSRSRGELWRKGETSGNTMRLRALRYDCDADALVALVDASGPACHTGERTCFFGGRHRAPARGGAGRARAHDRRAQAWPAIPARATPPACWPTRELIGEKVREEAEEVTRAAREESDQRVLEETADVLYHLTVLLAARDLGLTGAFEELNARRR
ncbi:MAG: phosphoribosyl-AMP cyclohydrolase [Thermoleophilaceae bacterium]